MITGEDFSDNLAITREQIAKACEMNGRSSHEVTLLPVTKNWPVDAVRLCLGAGIKRVGENRVQEALKKMDEVEDVNFELIGHLQSNKAKQAIGRFSCIQSVDSEKILKKLGKLALEKNLVQKVLLQVNAGNDPAKFGLSLDDTSKILDRALNLPSLDIKGFMTIAPYDPGNNFTARKTFEKLRNLRDRLANSFGKNFPELSMGMSGDLTEAIAEGSTMIRVGSALFGERKRSK